MFGRQRQHQSQAVSAFIDIMGSRHVLTSARATEPFAKGNRFGGGSVLAVLKPGSLVDMWRALQVCVDHDLIVIPQSANTGLTGGSGPGDQDYDREIVIISTLRINQIHLINDAREAVCLAGSTLYELDDKLAPHGREPHSVIGSSSIGASVVGGIANNSGGSQIRKGPAFTKHAIFARVDDEGKVELVNHLGISLGDDPAHILDRLQRGEWDEADVTPPPEDSLDTEYSEHVREITDSPARYNANPKFLHEASGSAGKLMVFAVRTRTFPKQKDSTTFYVGTNSPAELEALRRAILTSDMPLPISGEYMGRPSFDLAEKYGKDTFVSVKHAGSREQIKLFALKNWANGVFAKLPFFGQTVADSIAQGAFSLLPQQLPDRMLEYRDRFEHHLLLVVSGDQKQRTEEFLTTFFAEVGHDGDFFICTADEAQSAMLHRFGAASAATRYFNLHRDESSEMITFDVALTRDDEDWLEVLPTEISDQLHISSYYGHFFCHVLHQDHVAKKGVDPVALKKQMMALLEERGAAVPAEHNYGRLYQVPPEMEAHFKELDPCNVFNPGVGETSPHKNWG
ncbi:MULTISPECIES: D-lactate dehydrogenase [Brevibacterium]|uniref:Quinone-dependent D-lactate dehydrogenase n=3 Tax=Brevibacterium TaxID=1696 RepID=A0A2A3Z2Z0_BREAU|nr:MULTISPECIES: D-lactate dehydrogenase [Brevibacterium]MDN5660995.1 D-lactate dehydrogenase [Brevibacterium aurantiacum]PCC45916.1 D-lactate dehydrogenase [Brevibacterium aurantiacum]SMX86965.1 D-lactate dehydrogenase [Brevibacterium antiquum]